MKIQIKLVISDEKKEITLEKNSNVSELLEKIGFKPDTVVVLKENKPVPIDYEIKDNEYFSILEVSSGG